MNSPLLENVSRAMSIYRKRRRLGELRCENLDNPMREAGGEGEWGRAEPPGKGRGIGLPMYL